MDLATILTAAVPSVLSAAVTSYMAIRKQGKDEQRAIIEGWQAMHAACEEAQRRSEARIQRLEDHLFG